MTDQTTPLPTTPPSFGLWVFLCCVVLVLDQASKQWIKTHWFLGESIPLCEILNVVRAHNTGVAFSFLASDEGWQRWFFSGLGMVASLVIAWTIKTHPTQKWFCLALSLIAAGALGNVLDRMLQGYVIDFLDFHWAQAHFAAFNVADSAITLGAILLIVDEMFLRREKPSPSADI